MTVNEIEQLRQLGEVGPLPAEVARRTEAALRAEMARTTVDQPALVRPSLSPPLARRGNGPGEASRQRIHRAWAGAAAAVVVLGAAGAVLASRPGAPTRDARTTGRPGSSAVAATRPTHAVTAAYVVARLQRAVNLNSAVLVTRQHVPDAASGRPVTVETWTSPGSHTSRNELLDAAGNPTTGNVLTTSAHQTTAVHIDYADRTWSTTTYPFGSSSSSSAPAELPETPSQAAASLRAAARAGRVRVVGTTTVDGQPAIELRRAVPAEGTFPAGTETTWVDPTTYLPIREVDTSPGRSLVSDYQWLPDTPANERLLTTAAAIPPGFTEVAPSTGTSLASNAAARTR